MCCTCLCTSCLPNEVSFCFSFSGVIAGENFEIDKDFNEISKSFFKRKHTDIETIKYTDRQTKNNKNKQHWLKILSMTMMIYFRKLSFRSIHWENTVDCRQSPMCDDTDVPSDSSLSYNNCCCCCCSCKDRVYRMEALVHNQSSINVDDHVRDGRVSCSHR